MGLGAALSNAVSGIKVNQTHSDIISRNISNAQTEGYTRKDVKVETIGGTATVSSIDRQVSVMLDKLDRTNISRHSTQATIYEGVSLYTEALGQPKDEVSPTAMLASMKSALITLSGSPSERAAQLSVVSMGKELASQLNKLSTNVSQIQVEVETSIFSDVTEINSSLYEIQKLNARIIATPNGSLEEVDLLDQMGRVLDKISGFMDINIQRNKEGQISIMTAGGSELVKGNAVKEVRYSSATGQLYAGDVNISPNGANRGFTQGSLGGLFALKNTVLPMYHDQLDAFAAALVEGFEREAPITADGKGLFTDGSDLFTTQSGLAARIQINNAADAYAGGEPSIIQNAGDTTIGSGDNSLPNKMLALFDANIQVDSAGLGAPVSLSKLATSLTGAHQQVRVDAEYAAATIESSAATISASRQNLQGVNIDDEMQRLILVEQSFTANAKVLSTVNKMLDTLLEAF